MLYHMYELNRALLAPVRASALACELYNRSPLNPMSYTAFGKTGAAFCNILERVTRHYGKPEFGITACISQGKSVEVTQEVVWEQPFCRMLHFRKNLENPGPKLLMVAPLSGHYASLLRGTVETLLPDLDIYITDWVDARMVPVHLGSFDLDDYIDYLIAMLRVLGSGTHIMAVCQPSVPVLATVSLLDAAGDHNTPLSMTLIGGPIDARRNPTRVNQLAEEHGLDWFRLNAISTVPPPYPGAMRQVYPGFLQLSGFMSLNINRHLNAHYDLFKHLVRGDGDSAEKHRVFYDEYLSVMDLTAEFYLQTLKTVFMDYALPNKSMTHHGVLVDPGKIEHCALLTIEGELDDISGVGQTEAAHDLCSNLPKAMRQHHLQKAVGHYGTFNGSKFRRDIAPMIRAFITQYDNPDKKGS